MSNARNVAQRLVDEMGDGTASKDRTAWMAEASITLQRLLDEPPVSPVLQAVAAERIRQDAKWGGPSHDDEHNTETFCALIEGYTRRALVMVDADCPALAWRRLMQAAALAVAACESIDRKTS